ncbi:universal stress protein, partial [Streptomyces sp. NPDC057052]
MQPVVTVGPDGPPGRLAAARRAADEADDRVLTPRPSHARPLPAPGPARVPPRTGRNHPVRRSVRAARAELPAHHPH